MNNSRQEITNLLNGLFDEGLVSKQEVSNLLEMSRTTIYERLKKSNWKLKEIKLINENYGAE